jgi:plasmid maintenance system antidote protein VapI
VDIPVTPELAAAIQAEIDSEHLTYRQIAKRGGPAAPTMTKILKGEGTIGPSTAEKLEAAFRWSDGTIARLAHGQAVKRRKTEVLLSEATDAQILAELTRRAAG